MRQQSLDEVVDSAAYKNQWFTPENILLSFDGLINYLEEKKLRVWLSKYDFSNISPKKVGVVMAGNIPMVGVHDMICVLLSGHKLMAKLSHQDDVLLKFIANQLIDIEPEFAESIAFVDRLNEMEAVIATGSDNTARYFEYYFSKYPHIIRKNRTSVAVLNGDESKDDLVGLGHDIFDYFGMGCRNVSKLYLPKGYDLTTLIPNFEIFDPIFNHHKYNNNYFYQKSIFLVDQTPHLDSGFALFQQTENLVSPLSIIYYEFYEDENALKIHIDSLEDKIQCLVSNMGIFNNRVDFGSAQSPEIHDYADNVDTMEFLSKL